MVPRVDKMNGTPSLVSFVHFTKEYWRGVVDVRDPDDEGMGSSLFAKNDFWVWLGVEAAVLRPARKL